MPSLREIIKSFQDFAEANPETIDMTVVTGSYQWGKYDEFLPAFYKGVCLEDCRTFYVVNNKEKINAIAID